MTIAMPGFSAYFGACCDCGFTPSLCLSTNTSAISPDTKRPNPTFSSATTQTPHSKLITLLCGWYKSGAAQDVRHALLAVEGIFLLRGQGFVEVSAGEH